MTLNNFLKKYDKAGSVVLLEGKRTVAEADKPKLVKLGFLLASRSKQMRFRSGNAPGADELFAEGVSWLDPSRIELVLPYERHREKQSFAYDTVSIDELNLVREPEIVYASKKGTKTDRLIDSYVAGDRSRVSIKAAYLLRDTLKVMGSSEKGISPASFAIFYDDTANPKCGGTGHTLLVCERQNVPYLTQEVWMKWTEKEKIC